MNARTDIDRAARWGWPILEEAAEHASFKSERAIARKMLAERNRADMTRLLANLSESIPPLFHRQEFLLDGILVPMGLADRKEIARTAKGVHEVETLERDISAKLREAAELLDRRDELTDSRGPRPAPNGVLPTCSGSPFDWIRDGLAHADPDTQGRAASSSLPAMEHLDERYDLKYWPRLPDVLHGLADRFSDPLLETVHPLLDFALWGYAKGKASRAPVMRILWAGQLRQGERVLPLNPDIDQRTAPLQTVRLDDTDMAALVNITTEDEQDDPCSVGTVSTTRRRLIEKAETLDPAFAQFLADST